MTGYAWESFITRLLNVGVNAAAGLIRIALLIVLAYVLTRLLRAGLNRLEILLIRATEKTEPIPGAAGKDKTGLESTPVSVLMRLPAAPGMGSGFFCSTDQKGKTRRFKPARSSLVST